MLNILPIPVSDILLYLNIAFGVILFLAALIGFIRGTRKSLVHLIVWIVLFVVGLFTCNLVIKSAMNLDISKFNLNVNGKTIVTLNSFLQEYLVEQFPNVFTKEMLVEGTNAYAFIQGIILFAGKIVYWILWFILCLIFSQIIDAIVWAFVKPKKQLVNGKKKTPKKSFGSRMGGFGIGAFRGLLASLLLFFIISGLSSIATSVVKLNGADVNVGVVCTEDDLLFVNLSEKEVDSEIDQYLEEYGDVIDLLVGYRSTIPGKIFGAVKLGNDKIALDEKLFDAVFQIEGKNESIALRKEINKLALIMQNEAVKQILTEGFQFEDLAKLNTDTLKEAIDVLTSLDTIKVIVPISVEILIYTDVLADALGEQYEEVHKLLLDNINKFSEIDYGSEIQKVGYAFVDIVALLGDGLTDIATIDYLNLDSEKITQIFNELSQMELLDLVAPVAVSYALSSDYIKDALANAGFTVEDLHLEEVINKEDFFSHEFLLIPELYKAVIDLNIKIDGENIDFTNVKEENVDKLVQTLFKFYIVENIVPVVASTLYVNFSPEEYKSLITEEEIKTTDWKEELSPILTAATVILKTDILSSSDPLITISEMSDEQFESVGKYISQSKLLCNHMNDLIDILVKNANIEGFTIEGLDSTKGENWDETEIVSLLKAAKVIINTGIISAEDPLIALKSLNDESIDKLSSALSNSKFFTKNLDGVINYLINQINIEGLKLETLDASKGEKWDETELKNLLHAFKIVLDSNIINANDPMQAIKELSTEQIDSLGSNLANSKFFTKNLNNIIDYLIKQVDLGDITFEGLDSSKGEEWNYDEIHAVLSSLKTLVSLNIVGSSNPMEEIKNVSDESIESLAIDISSSTFMTKNLSSLLDVFTKELDFKLAKMEKDEWTSNEIYSVFKSFKTIASAMKADSLNITDLLNLSEKDLDILLESKFFRESLKNILVDKSKEGQELELLKGIYEDDNHYYWNDVRKETSVTYSNNKLLISEVNNAEKYIIYKNGIYFASTDLLSIDLSTITDYSYSNIDSFSASAIVTSGELRNVFNAISCLEINDINNISIDLRNVVKNKDELFKSFILVETLVDQIRQQETVLTIPSEYQVGGTGQWKDENGNIGELNKIIMALDIALGISSSEQPVTINNISVDNISLKNIINNKETILASDVISATIITKIQELSNDNTIIIPNEYLGNDYSLWKDTETRKGELSLVLDALNKTITLPDTGFEVNVENIELNNILDNKDEILKSAILTATIVDKIIALSTGENSVITIPSDYQVPNNHYWNSDYELWKNVYTSNYADVVSYGELSNILNSLSYALINTNVSINNIQIDNISLKNVIDNRSEVFKSIILSYTIIDTIRDINTTGEVVIPSEYLDSYDIWLGSGNELDLILDAIDAIGIIPATGFEINISDLTIEKIVNNVDAITASAILSATFIDKIIKLNNVLTVPDKFNVNSTHHWNTDYQTWKETNELNNFIKGLNYAIVNKNIAIDGLSVNNISLQNVIDNKEEVFTSEILAATLVGRIQELSTSDIIVIPNEYMGNYEYWMGTNKELVLFLDALSYVVDVPETGFDISTSSINLNNIIINQDQIFKSAILTATITDKIEGLSTSIVIPSEKKVASTRLWESDYDFWKNTYSIDYNSVVKYGELSHMLNAIDQILKISSSSEVVTIESLNTKLNNIYLEDIISDRHNILKSYIISATIIDKVNSLDGNGLVLPTEYKILASTDYDKWMNVYDDTDNLITTGELDRLLLSVYSALGLTTETHTAIDCIEISSSIDTMIKNIVNDSTKEFRNNLLGSIVISETIVSQIVSFKSLNSNGTNYIVKTENNQRTLNNNIVLTDENNRGDWYSLNNGVVEEKELWNVLTSVAILIGKSNIDFSDIDEFNIDTLISAKLTINYNSESYEVIDSDIEVMLKSYIMEEVFANTTENLISNGSLSTFFDSTLVSNFNYYKDSEKVKVMNDEYDLRTFLESFYIMNRYINYSNLQGNLSKLIDLGKDENSANLNDLAAGMVISRVFRGSIANIYNGLFLMYYANVASNNSSLFITHPYDSLTKFDQSHYSSNPINKVTDHDNFVSDYKVISNEYSLLK